MLSRHTIHDIGVRASIAQHFDTEPDKLHISRKGKITIEGKTVVRSETEFYDLLDLLDQLSENHP